ncbi:MAG: selenocysteine-specific elongation factor [Acidimicrobiales bacterium]|jgi:selenocysteine-specific elongation factor
MTVIATAGHVDHGKSTLVLALTGTDPDRLEEEKARGLTIDLGFASATLPSGHELSFIDVPGHTRFLRNMLAGVGAVQGCLFVVDATEGWKPQSEEHLRILDLLGIEHGVVALTKVDQVDDELLELAMMDLEEHTEGTFLEGAPIAPVAAPTGQGIPELKTALDQLVVSLGPPPNHNRPRLWIDRSFAPAGAGTVVTGTITTGSIDSGEELSVAPVGVSARIRGLQNHHRQVETVPPGNRVAVNLTGVSHGDLGRGDVLVRAGDWHHTKIVDAELTVLAALDHDVSRRGAYLAYIGSGEFPAKVRVLGTERMTPGTTGPVRLYLRQQLPLLPGDRFILRESGRDETVGGGVLLDVEPQLTASRAKPDRSIDRMVAERGWVTVDHLRRLTGVDTPATVGNWVVDPQLLDERREAVLADVAEAGALGLDVATLDDRDRSVLPLLDDVTVENGRAVLGEPDDPLADHLWLAELVAKPFTPPGPDGHDRAEIRELVRRGTVVEQDGVHFAASSLADAAQLLSNALAAQPDGLTVAEVRDLLGTSRKYVLPILGWFDRTGMTKRRDDFRIAGPRLPEPNG